MINHGAFPDYENMGGAPVETVTIVDGTTTYFCMSLIGTATSLSDKKFKILRKKANAFGGNTYCAAFSMEGGVMKGGIKYELAATDLATVAAYTYNL